MRKKPQRIKHILNKQVVQDKGRQLLLPIHASRVGMHFWFASSAALTYLRALFPVYWKTVKSKIGRRK